MAQLGLDTGKSAGDTVLFAILSWPIVEENPLLVTIWLEIRFYGF